MTKINLDELIADREAGTDGPWRFDGDWHRLPTILSGPCNEICTVKKRGFPGRSDHTKAESANARRIARLPDLEAAYLEAVELLERWNEYAESCGDDSPEIYRTREFLGE